MPLHIEVTGPCEPKEWEALAAFIAVMRGTTALTPTVTNTVTITEADPIPAGASVAVVAAPPPPPPAADPAPADIADALIAAEEKRVAAAPPPPPPLATPAGVELDSRGLPWDARIHASTKVKNTSDDTWRNKRGVDKALLTQVEAELKQVMAAPAAPVMPQGDAADEEDAPAAPPPPPPPPAGDTPAPPPPPPPADEPAADLTAFAGVMRLVVAKQTAGTVSAEQVAAICQQLGLTGVRDLAKRPDLIPAFEALLP